MTEIQKAIEGLEEAYGSYRHMENQPVAKHIAKAAEVLKGIDYAIKEIQFRKEDNLKCSDMPELLQTGIDIGYNTALKLLGKKAPNENREKIIKEFEYEVKNFSPNCTSDEYFKNCCKAVLDLLKEETSEE